MAGAPPLPSTAPPTPSYPLDECYQRAGRKLPIVGTIDGAQVPEPYRSLLVHHHDMTSTLEKFHGERIELSLLRTWRVENFYFREVVLLLEHSKKAVEFGAIRINLRLFTAAAQQVVLEAKHPLGRILHDYAVPYHSNPRSFLKLEADEFIQRSLRLHTTGVLYGRRNTLSSPEGESLAEIVEILPP